MLLLTPPPKAVKKAAAAKAVKAAVAPPECELVHLDHKKQCGCLCIRGVAYFIEGEADEAEVLTWKLTRKDGAGVKVIQVVDAAGEVECDCEDSVYRSNRNCKHAASLRRYGLVSPLRELAAV